MLTTLSPEKSLQLRTCFLDSGYVEAHLRQHFGVVELPSVQLRNLPRLMDRTCEPTLLNALLRWFWLGLAQARKDISEVVPDEVLSLLLDSGMLASDGEGLVPQTMVVPFDDFLVASDSPAALYGHQPELVLWPNPTSKFMIRFAVRRLSRATLDLGTGTGILSLGAARHSDAVVATDLNPRAVTFARFNAWLNGVDNIELLTGDCFAPVHGRRFDLILSNPPFFITPQTDYMFCDNPMELDGLCRRLVKEAPAYLNEDGYMQMLCEWAQISGQPWHERIAEWLDGTGCDAWVMKGTTQDPAEYAQRRIRETTPDSSGDEGLYDGYMQYYRQRGVELIHGGLIVLRRRNGSNWARIEEVPETANGEMGDVILATFAAHDLVRSMDGDKLLSIRPKIARNVRLEQVCCHAESRWQQESMTLRLVRGFPFHMAIQPLVAEFLAACDGTRTAGEAIQVFASVANAPMEQVQSECLVMIRRLLERGFLVAAPTP